MIIGLYGPQGIGKTTLAMALETRLNFVRLSFAGPRRQLYQRLETEMGRPLNQDIWLEIMRQQVGLLEKGPEIVNIVIDDVRFDNEFHWISNLQDSKTVELLPSPGLILRDQIGHPSETDRLKWVADSYWQVEHNDANKHEFCDWVNQLVFS